MPTRLRGWDYGGAGAYFITACTYRRRPYFGAVDNDGVSLSALGGLARDCLERVFARDGGSIIEASVIMPDHVHMLVQQDSADPALPPIDLLVRDMKAKMTHEARARALLGPREHLWQRGYFDRIVRSQQEHDALRAYIETNPLRWTLCRARAST